MLGVSFDSALNSTNFAHGRWPRRSREPDASLASRSVKSVLRAAKLAAAHGIEFKINTVVTQRNKDEDLASVINLARPSRWKVFEVLRLDGENTGVAALSNVEPLLISPAIFDAFVARSKEALTDPGILKEEPNDIMRDSYLIVDEEGRFLDCSRGGKTPSPSTILEVGALRALAESFEEGARFDSAAFKARDGDFYLAPPPPPPPSPAVEVELKFAPPPSLEAQLLRQSAAPPQRRRMQDVYYDTAGHQLTMADHWLRERDGAWELKSPTPGAPALGAGDLRVDFYDEATTWPGIASALELAGAPLAAPLLPPAASAAACLAAAGLAPFVRVDSDRRSYTLRLAGHEVRVDIDTALFYSPGGSGGGGGGDTPPLGNAYEIGEVELLAARAGTAPRDAIREVLHELDIAAEQPVRGKLLEFIYRHRQEHWRALASSGLLADKLGECGQA